MCEVIQKFPSFSTPGLALAEMTEITDNGQLIHTSLLWLKQGCIPKTSLLGGLEVVLRVVVVVVVCKPNLVKRYGPRLRQAFQLLSVKSQASFLKAYSGKLDTPDTFVTFYVYDIQSQLVWFDDHRIKTMEAQKRRDNAISPGVRGKGKVSCHFMRLYWSNL